MKKHKVRQLEPPLELRASDFVSHAHGSFGGKFIGYTIRRSRRRGGSFTLTIDERGLRVGVPWHATQRAVESELRKHEAWIVRKLGDWEKRRAPPRRWEDGEVLMLLGTPLRLTLATTLRTTVKDGDRLLVGMPSPGRPDDTARAVIAWLRGQALACFETRVAHYVPRLPVRAPEIRLSEARTRWGSCHPAGRVHLNWRLIQLPLRLVDYVIVHELAHLKEMNHSPRFWQTVAGIIPDYAARRREIRTEAHRYLVS